MLNYLNIIKIQITNKATFRVNVSKKVLKKAYLDALFYFQLSEPFRYKNKQIKYGEGLLSIKQARLPFDIGFESLKTFNVLSGYNYSSTGDQLITFFHQFSQFFSPIVLSWKRKQISYWSNALPVFLFSH